MNEQLLQPFKTINIDDLPDGAWQYITGTPEDVATLETYYQAVPWLFRGVDIRANSVAAMPFGIFRGADEVDNNEDYKNIVGILPRPDALFSLIEAALTIWNYAYLFKKRSLIKMRGLRYLLPTSITEDINEDTGEPMFLRVVGSKRTAYTADDIAYFWGRDPYTEIGRPKASPAKSAAAAAGVLFNVDEFAAAFFARGAIKATIFSTSTNVPPQERTRLKDFIDRYFRGGTSKSWSTEVLNADAVTITPVGEGIESLSNNDLSEDKRIDIAAALGIPFSVLFSNASNRATAEQDDLHLYSKTIVPECNFIAAVLNDQVLEPMGYRLKFKPETLDIFQEDEEHRAAAMSQFADAITKAETEEMAFAMFDIFGVEVSKDAEKLIRAHYSKKEERAAEMREKLNTPAQSQEAPQNGTEPAPQSLPVENNNESRAIDLDKWHRKALKRLEAGRSAACPFVSDHIEPAMHGAITGALESVETPEALDAVFNNLEWIGYP